MPHSPCQLMGHTDIYRTLTNHGQRLLDVPPGSCDSVYERFLSHVGPVTILTISASTNEHIVNT
jgi:hypothetical protein